MVGHVIAVLRRSPIVKELEVIEAITEESVQFLRVKAQIIDGSTLHIRELLSADYSKYSYHWQTQAGETLLRWDNAPHHPEISTHPDHRHEGERVYPSSRASIEDVLTELSTRLKRLGNL